MSVRFGLICAAAIATLCGYARNADAQIVAIGSTGYVAANGNVAAKVDPSGTYTVPANVGAGTWKVTWDYGTTSKGVFTYVEAIGTGGTVNIPAAGGAGNWGPIGQETLLKNPLPAGMTIRVRLQKKVGADWVDQGNPTYSITLTGEAG